MFQPFVLGSGLVAWRNLQRTMPVQKQLFSQNADQKRLSDHFEQNAVGLRSAESLVSDRRLREVSLTAFGLQDDLNNTYFVQRILAEGTTSSEALANRLADSRYNQLAKEFAFDGATSVVGLTTTKVATVLKSFQDQAFELSVGQIAPDLRLALNTERELQRVGDLDVSDDAKWFTIMGNPPLRQVFETALGLPASFGRLDIEQQLGIFRERAERAFGVDDVTELSGDTLRAKLIDRFLLREQVQQGFSLSSGNVALQLLRA